MRPPIQASRVWACDPTQHSSLGSLQPIHLLIAPGEQNEGGRAHLVCLESSSAVLSCELKQWLFGLCC